MGDFDRIARAGDEASLASAPSRSVNGAIARQNGSVVLERIPYDAAAWEARVGGHPDLEVYHGSAWLDYLAASQHAEPVMAVVHADGRPVGYFVGAIVRRYGIRILGSPLRGWGTQSMGFLLEAGFERRRAAEALVGFAFGDLGCLHVEISDRLLSADAMAGSSYVVEVGRTFEVDLGQPEETILAAMRSTTRNYVRQAGRRGLMTQRSHDVAFADTYHAQLVEVFARQGLVPTYGVERVRQLIRSLEPAGQVLLLHVRPPDGASIATAIVIGRNHRAVLWGAAFRRAHADLHPNEILHWEAMRYWRSQGILRYDMGGGGDYKAKYGGAETPVFVFHRSRFAVLRLGRSAVRNLVRARQILAGRRAVRALSAGSRDPVADRGT